MAYRDHILRCNAKDLSRFRPFVAANRALGWVSDDRAAVLARLGRPFEVRDDVVILDPALATPEERSAAMADVADALVMLGALPRVRGELYAVKTRWAGPELFRIDRAAVPFFGLKAYGVHMNGYVRTADGRFHLWIGRRAADKRIAPNKLDNVVAGGQPAGLSLRENLIKEAAEEAAIDRALAEQAICTGAITYCFEAETGLKPDTMFCYDLELPEDFVPTNTDGEISEFMLWPVEKVLETIRDTDAFKFNVNLVILDFAIRHGIITPDTEPDYEALVAGLRAPHPTAHVEN